MARFQTTIVDDHTNEVAVLSSNDEFLLREKMEKKFAQWDRRAEKTRIQQEKEDALSHAETLTEEAQAEQTIAADSTRAAIRVKRECRI